MQLVDLLRGRAVTIGAAAVLALAVAGGAAWFFFSPAIQSLAGWPTALSPRLPRSGPSLRIDGG